MPTRIDHIIFASADLAAAEEAFGLLGFHVTGGGTHPHLGTRNRVIVLGEGYLELVAVADPAIASPELQDRIGQGAGYLGFAVQADDIEREAQAMRERGVDARGPRAGRLVGPDGTARGWRTVLVGSDDLWAAAEPLPFLIQHDATGAEHQRQLGGVDGLAAHPNGATRIVAVVVATSDLPAMRERYARVLGMESAGDAQAGDELGAMTLTLNLDEGREHIVLARSLAQGYVTEGLLAAGASVCLVNIAIASCAVAERWLAEHGQTFIAEENGDLMVRVPGARGAPLRDWWMRLREQP